MYCFLYLDKTRASPGTISKNDTCCSRVVCEVCGEIKKLDASLGIKPYFETYMDPFESKQYKGVNVVGFIEGNDPKLKHEMVLLGAHYDHLGFGKIVNNDSIANGANDNASGTATVLAIANRLAHLGTNKRSVIIALFSGEEKGLLGSKSLAKKLNEQQVDLYTMLNFEMIGVPFTRD